MFWCPSAARFARAAMLTPLACSLSLLCAAQVHAAIRAPITGEIQEIVVDDPADTWSSGSIVVGGQRIILPRNLLIDLPANRLSLKELLSDAPPACLARGETGLARKDSCVQGEGAAFATILANRSDAGNLIAGDVFLQKGFEALSGTVTFLDTTDGYLRISGNPGDATTGTLVRINDPSSRFTIQQGLACAGTDNCSPDTRFGVDSENYTSTFSTGYPACLPSTVVTMLRSQVADQQGNGDAFCPESNRAGNPVRDSARFAPIQLGDPVNLEGNFERVNGVRFFAAHTLIVGRALTTALGQPDYLKFDETSWDVPAFPNQRLRAFFILFTTLGDSQLDVFGMHVDPTTGIEHEVPVGSTVGNPTTINQGIAPNGAGIARIRYDIDFVKGAPVKPGLSPCENLGNAGLGSCRAGANLVREFSVLSPLPRDVIARSRNRVLNPRLSAFDINGSSAPWGEYLSPLSLDQPAFAEVNLDALNTAFVFDGIPWNLDRRLSPGGCDGPCEDTPQPLFPFPASGINPASEPTLPAGAASRILSFFPFAAGNQLSWPPPDPSAVPIGIVPDAPLWCAAPAAPLDPLSGLATDNPPLTPTPVLIETGATTSSSPPPADPPTPLPSTAPATPAAPIDVAPAAPAAPESAAVLSFVLPPTSDAEVMAASSSASPAAASSSSASPADLVLSVELPRALPPIGIPSTLRVLVFNRSAVEVPAGTRLVVMVPAGTRSTLNPGWTTSDGVACNDQPPGVPCQFTLGNLAAGTQLGVPFSFTLAQVLPLDLRGIELDARLDGPISDPTPADNQIQASLAFAAFPDRAALTGLEVPEADNLGDFIQDRAAAVQLGKLLFWDMQLGSDGKQACATCHFNAGADSRSINQLNPGRPALGDTTFSFAGPNAQLTAADFPLHQLSDPSDRNSSPLRSRDEVVSSQGVQLRHFTGVSGSSEDSSTSVADPVFQLGGQNLRRVEPRNTPTVINAAFNDRNFWDGRAQNIFNGVNPFGTRDPDARLLARTALDASTTDAAALARGYDVTKVQVAIQHSSLASQAVGPPVSAFEMSFDGRTWPHVGKKLLLRDQPLPLQHIAADDSVLGALSAWPDPGARSSYSALIRAAFRAQWWDAGVTVTVTPDGPHVSDRAAGFRNEDLGENEYTLMMYNFSLFFGLAVQAYEATLVSDDTPFDRFSNGDSSALSPEEQTGLGLFFGSARCSGCHSGPLFTNASLARTINQPLERMLLEDDATIVTYDNGFYNIGVRPTDDDLGVGGTDPFGLPLSNTGLALLGRFSRDNVGVDPNETIAVSGSFKVPTLRNIALTAPYFHNGGQATLHQVLEFYRRGGDFANPTRDPDILSLVLGDDDIDALVAFLGALTDERVLYSEAPFDHPEIVIPNGAAGDASQVAASTSEGIAADRDLVIAAVGQSGGTPLPRFLDSSN